MKNILKTLGLGVLFSGTSMAAHSFDANKEFFDSAMSTSKENMTADAFLTDGAKFKKGQHVNKVGLYTHRIIDNESEEGVAYNTLPPTPEHGMVAYDTLPPTPERGMVAYNTLPPTPERGMVAYNTLPPTPEEVVVFNTLPPTPDNRTETYQYSPDNNFEVPNGHMYQNQGVKTYNGRNIPAKPDYSVKTRLDFTAIMNNRQHIRC